MPDDTKHEIPNFISWFSVYGEAVKKSGISDIQKEKLKAIVEMHEPKKKNTVSKRKGRNKRK